MLPDFFTENIRLVLGRGVRSRLQCKNIQRIIGILDGIKVGKSNEWAYGLRFLNSRSWGGALVLGELSGLLFLRIPVRKYTSFGIGQASGLDTKRVDLLQVY